MEKNRIQQQSIALPTSQPKLASCAPKALAIEPKCPEISSKEIGQWLAIPGCSWKLQLFPYKFVIQPLSESHQAPAIEVCFDCGLERAFPDRLLASLDLKKGQILVELAAGSLFIRWRLYSGANHQPIFELLKLKGAQKTLKVLYNQAPCEWTARLAIDLWLVGGSLEPRQPQGPFRELWMGTNQQLDWNTLKEPGSNQAQLFALIHQWTRALRWSGEPDEKALMELQRQLDDPISSEVSLKLWWQKVASSCLGPIAACWQRAQQLGLPESEAWSSTTHWISAMGRVVFDKWCRLLGPSSLFLSAQVSSKAPSGRGYAGSIAGVNIRWRWRGCRVQMIYLEALETKRFSLQLAPLPKRARLSVWGAGQGAHEAQILHLSPCGKLLDVELVAGTNYLLDRLEY